MKVEAISKVAMKAIEDDVVTEPETQLVAAYNKELGITFADYPRNVAPYYQLAQINGGSYRLFQHPVSIRLAREEAGLYESAASLLKLTDRYQANYGSVSVPVGDSRSRVRAGQARGRTILGGGGWQVADRGTLTVTNQRVVFAGAGQTIEEPLSKLITVHPFNDGVAFNFSGRRDAASFKVDGWGLLVAAFVKFAAELAGGNFIPPQRQLAPIVVPPMPDFLRSSGYQDVPSIAETAGRGDASAQPPIPGHGHGPGSLLDFVPARASAAASAVDPELGRMVDELDRSIAMRVKVEEVKMLVAGLAGTDAPPEQLKPQLVELIHGTGQVAEAAGLPAALKPSLEVERGQRSREPHFDVPDEIEVLLMHLGALGLTPLQVHDLGEDNANGTCSRQQIERVIGLLENDERNNQVNEGELTPTGDGEMDLLLRELFRAATVPEETLGRLLVAARGSAGADQVEGVKDELRRAIAAAHNLAEETGFPFSLTPRLADEGSSPDEPVMRDVPASLDPVLVRLGQLGLRPEQIRAVRDDYRRARCTGEQLERVATLLASTSGSVNPPGG